MAHYVKFLRGTPEAFRNLQHPDMDTLYFIYEEDEKYGDLYLGSKLIAGSADSQNVGSLAKLEDVLISEGLANKDLLIYDANQNAWVNRALDDIIEIYVGPNETSSGVPGLVPSAPAASYDLFLRSDGTWASVDGVSQLILNITNDSKVAHDDLIAAETEGLSLGKGDICIIKDIIIEDKYSHFVYIYDGTEWLPMDGQYSADNVYFNEDLSHTATAGQTLKQVLENIRLAADERSVTINNNVLSLKNFGIQYYRYIAASGTEGADDYVAAHYELQVVDETHPWAAGLEPRVTLEDGELVLGWFEQNPTTIDGVNAQVSALQTAVNDLQQTTENLENAIGVPANADSNTAATGLYAELDKKANVADVYTKTETDSRIGAAVAAAEHLKRKIVDEYADIETYIEKFDDADQYIFMVPVGPNDYDNKYEEYIVIEGVIEPVGNWSVNLDDYVKKEDLLFTSINGSEFQVVEGQLNLLSIPQNKVVGLSDLVTTVGSLETELATAKSSISGLQATVSTLQDTLNTLNSKVITLDTKVGTLETSLNNTNTKVNTIETNLTAVDTRVLVLEDTISKLNSTYVTITDFNKAVGNLDDLLASENKGIQEQIDELKTQMSWQTLT